ncbi:MAG TPA: DNA alkylation repair protein [Chitinophagaceae bacterium]|jgi:hypothetical protein|nr:DNA alkylation repair protein [Chitinophagaceae bacterium]
MTGRLLFIRWLILPANPNVIGLHSIKIMAKTTTAKKAAKPAVTKKATASKEKTAAEFTRRLRALQSDVELEKIQRYFKSGGGQYGQGDKFMGVKMGNLFALAKEFSGMPVKELEKLLESPIHELRAGAISIMDKESRSTKITGERLKELYAPA